MERVDQDGENVNKITNMVHVTINYKGVDILFEVDYETASLLLNDHEAAQKYAEEMLALQEGENSNSNNNLSLNAGTCSSNTSNSCASNSTTWSSKSSTNTDHEATILFLQLRRKFATKFNDRKTIKNSLWQKISEKMNLAGYYVGTGRDGAEKCRQKFANLQRTYMSHVTYMRKTGTGKKELPPFFDELHDILGAKDKVHPRYLEDSLEDSPSSSMDSHHSTAESNEGSESKEVIKKRFGSQKRALRPTSHTAQIVEVIREHHKDDQQQRNTHFSMLHTSLEKQFEQRERLLNILEASLQRTSRKRRRVSSSSSE